MGLLVWAAPAGTEPRKGSREPLIIAGEVVASDVRGQPCGMESLVCGGLDIRQGVSVKIKLWDPQLVPRTRELAGVETATLAVRVL